MNDYPALRLRGLTKRYGTRVVLDHVNLDVPRGSVTALLGPNGAGKTTIFRILLGLVTPTDGEGQVLGYCIQKNRNDIASRLGGFVEVPAFYGHLTGRGNLEVLAHTSSLQHPDARIDDLLDLVRIRFLADQRVRTYSLGQRQRLALAAALLHSPEVLLLDEPSNGLDPAGMIDLRQIIASLHAGGCTIVLSTHHLHEVESVCTHVAVVHQGRVVAQGSSDELLVGPSGRESLETAYLRLTRNLHKATVVFQGV
jgi:ABC-2 type transport system ATP-binding protein